MEASLDEICVERVEQAPPSQDPVPYIDISSIDRSTKRIGETDFVTEANAPTRARQWVRENDVLVSMTRPNLNAVAKIGSDLDGAVASTGFDVLRPIGVLPDWVFYRVRTNEFVADVCDGLQGVVYPAIRPHDVRRHRLPIPPLPEQHRIVEAIESYFTRLDDAVATLERVQRNLKRYRASVLKAAVEGRLVQTEAELARAEGRDYEPASVLLERILAERRRRWEDKELAKMKAKGKAPKDDKWKASYEEPILPNTSDLSDLPEGWSWASVDQLEQGDRRSGYGVLVPGADIPGGVPLVRVGDIRGGSINGSKLKRISRDVADTFAKTYLKGGEVLLTLVGTVGRTAVVPAYLAGSNVARAVGVIPVSELVEPHWVEYWFRSPATRHRMVGKAHEVARKTLNIEDVRAAAVAVPPRSEQIRIREAIEDHASIVDSVDRQNEISTHRFARLRQSILKWAFKGRLVDQDPSDEPASVLLERIQAVRASRARRSPAASKRRGDAPR
jgi:type I restriction enzyme S subunit